MNLNESYTSGNSLTIILKIIFEALFYNQEF
jgi:hypothetical protein